MIRPFWPHRCNAVLLNTHLHTEQMSVLQVPGSMACNHVAQREVGE